MNSLGRVALLLAVACCVTACDAETAPVLDVPGLDPRTTPTAEVTARLRKAALLLEANASAEAEPLLRQVLDVDPDHRRARDLLVELLLDGERYDEAIPLLEAAIADDPKDLRSRALLAHTTHGMGDLRAAAKAYRAWLKVDRTNDEALYGWGRLLHQQGRYDDALEAFEKAEKRRAGRADVRSALGLTLQALGRLEEAEAKQRDALERDPRSAEAWFRLGDVISRREDGRSEEALEALRNAVRRDRAHLDAQLAIYRLLRLSTGANDPERAAEAERRWSAVLTIHGRKQVARRAGAPRKSGGGADDEARLLAILDESPDDVAARRRLAEWLHAEGHTDEAVVVYDAVLAAGERDPLLLYQAGAAHLSEGAAERAAELLADALDAMAESGTATPPPARRYLAWALLRADRAAESVSVAERAISERPDDRLARRCHGLARMRSGDLDAGLEEIAEAGSLR